MYFSSNTANETPALCYKEIHQQLDGTKPFTLFQIILILMFWLCDKIEVVCIADADAGEPIFKAKKLPHGT
jgi:hypothetical protein